MTLLYNLGIRLYYLLALTISPFNKKASLWIKGRKNVFRYLEENIDHKAPKAWFHVSSLGEFEQGRPIIEAFKKKHPNHQIILTFFSPSGYEIRKNYSEASYICYLPLDTPRNAKRFIKLTKPEFVIFIKYDYWFHFLKQAHLSGARLFLASGIFRKKQAFFKSYGKWYKQILTWFEHFFVQNEQSKALLSTLGIDKCTVAGDTRFDRVVQIAEQGKNIDIAKEFSKGKPTIVCGSTWPADENMLAQYAAYNKSIKIILAPHEINKTHIDSIASGLNVPYALFSEADNKNLDEAQVLIIDNIGMLSSIYKYGQIAYIGGGFGAGIHNTLEAAVYGVPVLFGPNYQKFKEAIELIQCKGGLSFSTYEELQTALDNLVGNAQALSAASNASKNYVSSMTGATTTIIDHLSA